MKPKKVAFVHPEIGFKPFQALGTYPLGILYLATTVRTERPDWGVRCYDEDSRSVLKRGTFKPEILEADAVGITALTSTAPRAYELADRLRDLRTRGKTNPNLKVIMGGMHVTAMPEEAIQHADAVLTGEGEKSIVRLIEEGRGIVAGERVEDLDTLVEPDYSLLDFKKRRLADWLYGTLASIASMRGCSFNCDFCSVREIFGPPRSKSPEKVFARTKFLREERYRRQFFHDDFFSYDKPRREVLFDMLIRARLGIDYIVQDRIDALQDGDYVERMARSGCTMVMFGLESPDKEFLRAHRKGLDLDKVEIGVKLLKKNRIVPYAFCMVQPEKPETTRHTIEVLRHLGIKYAQFTILTPMPGTRLYDNAKERIQAGWQYFTGLSWVTEKGDKAREAAEHLSETWRKFYSPLRAGVSALKLEFSEAALRLYGWYVGRRILDAQP
ncbi:B12-binding domain-containing radical SAM protein [Candidatus Pacearchaeota archaeon]|nr:B12-binding domain-containing radical SAM protein [Candidatus Pacearchaeota archaeon]